MSYIFMDESGDLGFNFSKTNTSRYFVMSFLISDSDDICRKIIAKTVKGKGVSFMENQAGWHGKAPNEEQFKLAIEELGGKF